MKRVKYVDESRMVDGIKVVIDSIEELEYDGRWTASGFLVKVDGKSHHFFGYPTDSDIRKLLKA